jgi:phage gpG-like protein
VGLRVTGDFSGLKSISARLKKTAQAKRAILKALEEEAINQVMEGFDAARDPYGTPWKQTIRGGEILQDKGGLKRSVFRKRGSDSFTIGFTKLYAAVHQFGATIKAKGAGYLHFKLLGKWKKVRSVRIDARPMVPTATRGLPPSWYRAFEKAAVAALRKILG